MIIDPPSSPTPPDQPADADCVLLLYQSFHLPQRALKDQLLLRVVRGEHTFAEEVLALVDVGWERFAEIEVSKLFLRGAAGFTLRPITLFEWLCQQEHWFGKPNYPPSPTDTPRIREIAESHPLGSLNVARLRGLPGKLATQYVEHWFQGDPEEDAEVRARRVEWAKTVHAKLDAALRR